MNELNAILSLIKKVKTHQERKSLYRLSLQHETTAETALIKHEIYVVYHNSRYILDQGNCPGYNYQS